MVDFSLQKIACTRTSKLKFADTMRTIELVEWLDHNQTTTTNCPHVVMTHADFSYFYMRTYVVGT